MDADMRRPTALTQFEKSNGIGLSDLLTRKLKTGRVVTTIPHLPNLHILPCGTRHPSPSELLGGERMTQVLQEFCLLYDFIVIDCPPLIVSDAQILSNRVDGMIMIVQPGHTRAIAALRPLDELRRIGAREIGVVLNRIPRNRDYYGGYHYYSPYLSHKDDMTSEEITPIKQSLRLKYPDSPQGDRLVTDLKVTPQKLRIV